MVIVGRDGAGHGQEKDQKLCLVGRVRMITEVMGAHRDNVLRHIRPKQNTAKGATTTKGTITAKRANPNIICVNAKLQKCKH